MEDPNNYGLEKEKELGMIVISALANGNCKGSKAILELYEHAGTAISAEELYNLENNREVKYIADKVFDKAEDYVPLLDAYVTTSTPDCPVELTDTKAIQQIKKELTKITYHLAAAMENNDLGQVEDLKEQQTHCLGYLKECLTPTGKIRKTSDTSRKLTLALARDVKYYLDKLARTNPELSNYLRDHVKIGKVCYWSDAPIKRKSTNKIA